MATSAEIRRRSKRLELRTTPEERELIERAAEVSGSDLTEFVLAHASDAARRILADRDRFHLSGDALAAWEAVHARRALDLPGLHVLMSLPSPFAECLRHIPCPNLCGTITFSTGSSVGLRSRRCGSGATPGNPWRSVRRVSLW